MDPIRRIVYGGIAVMFVGLTVFTFNTRPSPPKPLTLRAHDEVTNIELAVAKICQDAGVDTIRALLAEPDALDAGSARDVIELHSKVVYHLLRRGGNADEVKPELASRLGESYWDLSGDPWGRLYHFYIPNPGTEVDTAVRAVYAEPANAALPPGTVRKGEPLVVVISAGPNGSLELFPPPNVFPGRSPRVVKDDITNLRAWEPEPSQR